MKYCTECGTRYEDTATACPRCPGSNLVHSESLPQHRPLPGEWDALTFVRAGTAEDPLTAEGYLRLLESEGIPVFSRPRRSGTVAVLTSGLVAPWWELLVPEEHLERAAALLAQEKAQLDATADEAGRAAEEEELETEAAAAQPSEPA